MTEEQKNEARVSKFPDEQGNSSAQVVTVSAKIQEDKTLLVSALDKRKTPEVVRIETQDCECNFVLSTLFLGLKQCDDQLSALLPVPSSVSSSIRQLLLDTQRKIHEVFSQLPCISESNVNYTREDYSSIELSLNNNCLDCSIF